LTTFLLSCINLGVRDLASPAMVIAPALAYGGLVQLLAGMWEIAVGKFFVPVYSSVEETLLQVVSDLCWSVFPAI
jgi:succinate-acetate transporter protein